MKKFFGYIIVLFVVFQIFLLNFSYAKTDNSSKQNPVCGAPGETMVQYMQFQAEALNAILGSDLNDMRFEASMSTNWLFTDKVLTLSSQLPGKMPNSVNFMASTIWGNFKSVTTAGVTTTFLLELTLLSIVHSNTVGLGILFESRPIVRDYKSLMDIETRLFNAAYYLSDKVSLIKPLDSDLSKNLGAVIKKYQKIGLIEGSGNISSSASVSDVIGELVSMNAVMKQFLLDPLGYTYIGNFCGCMGNCDVDNCSSSNAVLKFTDDAVDNLKNEYKGVRLFTNCDVSVSSFKNIVANVGQIGNAAKSSWKMIVDSWNRLKNVFSVGFTNMGNSDKRSNRCSELSAYEIAQFRAYYGNDWNCGNGTISFQTGGFSQILQMKKAIVDAGKKTWTVAKTVVKDTSQGWKEGKDNRKTKKAVKKAIKNTSLSSSEKEQEWYQEYGTVYNREFSVSMLDEFESIFADVMSDYQLNQLNSSMADQTEQLIKIQALVEQVDELGRVMGNDADGVRGWLRKIEKYQCSM